MVLTCLCQACCLACHRGKGRLLGLYSAEGTSCALMDIHVAAMKRLHRHQDVAGDRHADWFIVSEGHLCSILLVPVQVSVPDGAPRDVREGELPDPKADTKFAYLWNCRAVLDSARRILLATDNDGPGQALAEELARRLGKERCFRVRYASGGLQSLHLVCHVLISQMCWNVIIPFLISAHGNGSTGPLFRASVRPMLSCKHCVLLMMEDLLVGMNACTIQCPLGWEVVIFYISTVHDSSGSPGSQQMPLANQNPAVGEARESWLGFTWAYAPLSLLRV